jgi:flavodoxin
MIRTLTIIYATGTGHTEFVVDTVIAALAKSSPDLRIVKQRAEASKPEDVLKGDVLLLACGSWNTNNVEGMMSPYMHDFLAVRAAKEDLKKKPVAVIGLGDERYFFTAKSADRMVDYCTTHNGSLLLPALKIINEPFDQAPKIQTWAKEFAAKISALPVSVS